MPIYEYRCEACGEHEEKLQGFGAPSSHDCPSCGAASGMKRQISRSAFALAGGGWYAQGYGAEAPKASEASAKSSGAKAEGSSSQPAAACSGGCACHGGAR